MCRQAMPMLRRYEVIVVGECSPRASSVFCQRFRKRSPAQFAQKKKTTEHVVRSAIRSGFLTAIRFNGQDRIPPRELDRWDEIWGSDASATT